MSKRNRIKADNLSRLMAYILGHRPDEFGLVPDRAGFVTYKELLWAMHEEPGWGYVRQGHINEVLLGKDRARFQEKENRIRALERHWHINFENPSESILKILFTAVRRRAHPVVMEKGLVSVEGKYVVLSPDREMALRIGRRRDQDPVLLEVLASSAQEQGVKFFPFGDLYLTDRVLPRFVSGPPLPREDRRGARGKAPEKQTGPPDFQAGTFALDINRDPDVHRHGKGKKRRGWKEEARRLRGRRK